MIEDYDEIQRTLGTRATLLSVAGLTQPATFGLWRPVVLLPDTLGESRLPLRRAVVTHELLHVQRRDWLWVLAEESLRSLLWFHPAILWLTSRIQLAREELVDELTVLATGIARIYIEALLAFADASGVRPAPAFARRQHLFTRILRLSKERSCRLPASSCPPRP
jgi:D-alanyl-D-alanine endopeptidase (penicillin-binding protein 7)